MHARCLFRAVSVAAAMLCATVSHSAEKSVTTSVAHTLLKSGASQGTFSSKAACVAARTAERDKDKSTKTSGQVRFVCREDDAETVTYGPTPTCPALPAPQGKVVVCPTGTSGAYTQTLSWTSAPYPTCAVEGEWTPAVPTATQCPPTDTDNDGVPDSTDRCPTVRSETPDGCPATPPAMALYINAGGAAVSNYLADQYFVGGLTSNVCRRTYSGIFSTRRYAPDKFEYRIPVTNGGYVVRLLTRECWNDATGLRVQSASIEGVGVPSYDTFTTANGGVISTERTVTVSDSVLNITVTAVTGDAILNGIDVVPSGGTGPEPEEPPPPPSGTATLSWRPSINDTNGKALTNLAGYRIHYGASATELVHSVQIANSAATTYTLNDLAPGTYWFAVGAYTSNGTEGGSSNVVSKTIR